MNNFYFHENEFVNLNNYQIADLLKNLKNNYGLKSKAIAAGIGTTETTLSLWLNHKKQMNKQSRDHALSYLWNYWQPGVLIFHFSSKDIYWSCADIKDMFNTHIVPRNLTKNNIKEENEYINKIKFLYELEKPQYEIFHKYKTEEALIFGPDDESYCNTQVTFNSKPIILYSDLIMNQRWKENPNLLIRRVNGDDSIPPT